jgi:hypothetical protein
MGAEEDMKMALVMKDTALMMKGYKVAASYYDKDGRELTFWTGNGQIFAKTKFRNRSPWIDFFRSTEEANNWFKKEQADRKRYGGNGDMWRKKR